MKIWLATTAPGTEGGDDRMLPIRNRLLSFHHITTNELQVREVFNQIKKLKQKRRKR